MQIVYETTELKEIVAIAAFCGSIRFVSRTGLE